MNHLSRPLAALIVLAVVAFSTASPAWAQFDRPARHCRSAIARSGSALAMTTLEALSDCHKSRAQNGSLSSTNCNDVDSGDLRGIVNAAEARFSRYMASRCRRSQPADVLYSFCPAPCASSFPVISDFTDVAGCMVCLERAGVEGIAETVFGTPASPLPMPQALCHHSIRTSTVRFLRSIFRFVRTCQSDTEFSGSTTTDDCTEPLYLDLVDRAFTEYSGVIATGDCSRITLPRADLGPCGETDSPEALALCVLDRTRTIAQQLVASLLEFRSPITATTSTTTTTTTTTTTISLPPSAALCPSSADIVLYSRDTHTPCVSNDDCEIPRTCNASFGTCTSATDVDWGWTGAAHDTDVNDGRLMGIGLYCPGPADPGCGECTVRGIVREDGNCRCANDSRKGCNDAFSPASGQCGACVGGPFVPGSPCTGDGDCSAGNCALRCSGDPSITCSTNSDCAGDSCVTGTRCGNGRTCSTNGDCTGSCTAAAACECFAGTPTPMNSGGVPLCIVHRLAADVSGTVDVDLGTMNLTTSLRERIYLGQNTLRPCPTCAGRCSNDATAACIVDNDCSAGNSCVPDTAGDGNRGGICIGGASDGLSCDAAATNATFPVRPAAAGGAAYSMDCLPDARTNVSGTGLAIVAVQTTGESTLTADLSCGGAYAELSCPCQTCSGGSGNDTGCSSDIDCASVASFCSLAPVLSCSGDGDCAGADVGPCSHSTGRCSRQFSLECATNADCLNVDTGPCTASTCSPSPGNAARPNQCDGGLCSDDGGGEGACTTGPDDSFCDGVIRADATGLLACSTNDDCVPSSIGVDGGNCTMVERRPCFGDSISVTGSADPHFPVTAATFCLPPVRSDIFNLVIGLPGPARTRSQTATTAYCTSDPSVAYTPGGGGCP